MPDKRCSLDPEASLMGKNHEQTTLRPEVTVIGAAIMDMVVGPVSEAVFRTGSQPMQYSRLTYGGDALNESLILSKLGVRTELITKVGNDETGERILAHAAKSGIILNHAIKEDGLTTGINVVLVDSSAERYFLTNPESSLRKLSEEDILPALDEAADIVSFASLFVSPLLDIPAMERVFRKIKEKPGRILTADMTKAKNGETLRDLAPLIPHIDVLLPNREEASLLTGEADPYRSMQCMLEAGFSCVVMKIGGDGCLVGRGGKITRVAACPVTNVSDTTGAGDSFVAGFLYGLTQELSAEKCAGLGSATAACTVEAVGATEGKITPEEIMRRFERN